MNGIVRFFLLLSLCCPACRKSQEKNDRVPAAVITPTTAVSSAENQWVTSGDFAALAGSVRSGGGLRSPFPAGERLLVTLHVGNLETGVPLEAVLEIADEKGSWTGPNRQILPADQVRGPSGMLQAVLQTESSWPAGNYTLYVRLAGGARKGEWFIPIAITNAAVAAGNTLKILAPLRPRAGVPAMVRFLGPPGLSFSVRVDNQAPVQLQLPSPSPPPAFAVLEHPMDMPADAGPHAVYVSYMDSSGKPVSFGEPLNVTEGDEGFFSLRFSPHDGGWRPVWQRRQEGFLWIEDPRLSAPGALDVIVKTAKDEVLYMRRIEQNAPAAGKLAIPFVIPEFSPAGRLTFQVRWSASGRTHQAQADLQVEGEPISASGHFSISDLETGLHPAFLGEPGPLRSGRDWHMTFVVSGYKTGQRMETAGNRTIPVPVLGVRCAVRLWDLQGRMVAKKQDFIAENRPQLYVPPRHRLQAIWRTPRLPAGRYRLTISCDDAHSAGSAQLQRLVDVL